MDGPTDRPTDCLVVLGLYRRSKSLVFRISDRMRLFDGSENGLSDGFDGLLSTVYHPDYPGTYHIFHSFMDLSNLDHIHHIKERSIKHPTRKQHPARNHLN